MRILTLIPLLALVACSGENAGWNPNYTREPTRYGKYLAQREDALMGRRAEPPRVIPVTLPAKAPTAAQIKGPSPVQILQRGVGGAAAAKAATRRPAAAAPAKAAGPVAIAPARTGDNAGPAPLLVRYAAGSLHAPGVRVWPRAASGATGSCARYADAAAAQTDFVLKGGPAKDPLRLDPDGDGYVCGWDPAPYRQPRL